MPAVAREKPKAFSWYQVARSTDDLAERLSEREYWVPNLTKSAFRFEHSDSVLSSGERAKPGHGRLGGYLAIRPTETNVQLESISWQYGLARDHSDPNSESDFPNSPVGTTGEADSSDWLVLVMRFHHDT